MRALDRKLLRDLWDIKEQALAIAAVIGCGIAMFVMSLSTLTSLQGNQHTFYDRSRFADVFTRLKRAPDSLKARIEEVPGVSRVQTRVVKDVTLDVVGLPEPAVGRLISIPETRPPELNTVYLRTGRYLEPGHDDEVLVSEGFARVHGLEPGDKVTAVINGRKQALRIVGIGLSPEYIFQIRPGDMFPDDRRFGVFWMGEKALAAAFNMEGAFNDVTLTLMPGASEPEVLRRLDRLTEPYGGLGAYGRRDQFSNRFLSDEIAQLRAMGLIAPSIFLSIAAFLLNVVAARIIATQREQIAALKAFGYTNWAVGIHYLKMATVIVLVGAVAGVGVGIWLGRGLTQMYTKFYRFPVLRYEVTADTVALAILIGVTAAVLGTIGAVRRAVRLPPAEAMRPEPPATYRPTMIERLGLQRWLSHPARMILRHLERAPIKALLSCFGIAMGVAVMVLGNFSVDSLDFIIDVQFQFAQRHDLQVSFVEPRPSRAVYELGHLPGVRDCEPYRSVAVRLRSENRSRRIGLLGLESKPRLNLLIDETLTPVTLPKEGLVLSDKMADLLGVGPGDPVTVEVMEGERPIRKVPVAMLVREYLGSGAYMEIRALNQLLREGRTISGGYLASDEKELGDLYYTLKHTPGVAAVTVRKAAIKSFQETLAENMNMMRTFNVLFAAIIAFGVVYNSARIALAERGRELASLRVMGFTRGEISAIFLGELAVLTLSAIPLGLGLGYLFAWLASLSLDTELYRIPMVVNARTYAFAVVVVLASTVVSGLIVRRKLDHLDLVAVLKTRE